MTHTQLVAACLLHASNLGLTVFNAPTGVARTDSGYTVRFGLIPGAPDIQGWLSVPGMLAFGDEALQPHLFGVFVGIECKTGNAVQSAKQRKFQQIMEQSGCLYILARCVDDIDEAVKTYTRKNHA